MQEQRQGGWRLRYLRVFVHVDADETNSHDGSTLLLVSVPPSLPATALNHLDAPHTRPEIMAMFRRLNQRTLINRQRTL